MRASKQSRSNSSKKQGKSSSTKLLQKNDSMTYDEMKKDYIRRGTVYGSEMRKDPSQKNKLVVNDYSNVHNHKVSDHSLLINKESHIDQVEEIVDNELNEDANHYLSYN